MAAGGLLTSGLHVCSACEILQINADGLNADVPLLRDTRSSAYTETGRRTPGACGPAPIACHVICTYLLCTHETNRNTQVWRKGPVDTKTVISWIDNTSLVARRQWLIENFHNSRRRFSMGKSTLVMTYAVIDSTRAIKSIQSNRKSHERWARYEAYLLLVAPPSRW